MVLCFSITSCYLFAYSRSISTSDTVGESASGTEKDDCKIITGQSIFDHIREKAKNFPLLTPSIKAYPPTSGGLILTRKSTREQERSKIHQQIVFSPSPESAGPEQNMDDISNYLTRKHQITAGNSFTIDLTDESGAFF